MPFSNCSVTYLSEISSIDPVLVPILMVAILTHAYCCTLMYPSAPPADALYLHLLSCSSLRVQKLFTHIFLTAAIWG